MPGFFEQVGEIKVPSTTRTGIPDTVAADTATKVVEQGTTIFSEIQKQTLREDLQTYVDEVTNAGVGYDVLNDAQSTFSRLQSAREVAKNPAFVELKAKVKLREYTSRYPGLAQEFHQIARQTLAWDPDTKAFNRVLNAQGTMSTEQKLQAKLDEQAMKFLSGDIGHDINDLNDLRQTDPDAFYALYSEEVSRNRNMEVLKKTYDLEQSQVSRDTAKLKRNSEAYGRVVVGGLVTSVPKAINDAFAAEGIVLDSPYDFASVTPEDAPRASAIVEKIKRQTLNQHSPYMFDADASDRTFVEESISRFFDLQLDHINKRTESNIVKEQNEAFAEGITHMLNNDPDGRNIAVFSSISRRMGNNLGALLGVEGFGNMLKRVLDRSVLSPKHKNIGRQYLDKALGAENLTPEETTFIGDLINNLGTNSNDLTNEELGSDQGLVTQLASSNFLEYIKNSPREQAKITPSVHKLLTTTVGRVWKDAGQNLLEDPAYKSAASYIKFELDPNSGLITASADLTEAQRFSKDIAMSVDKILPMISEVYLPALNNVIKAQTHLEGTNDYRRYTELFLSQGMGLNINVDPDTKAFSLVDLGRAIGSGVSKVIDWYTEGGIFKPVLEGIKGDILDKPIKDPVKPAPEEYIPTFREAEELNGIPLGLLENMGAAESYWREDVITGKRKSSAGAIGIMQFMPATARAYNLTDPTDPEASIHAAGRYMKDLLNKYQDIALAVAGYNMGETELDKYLEGKRLLPVETKGYVKKVLGENLPARWKPDVDKEPVAEAKKLEPGVYELNGRIVEFTADGNVNEIA